MDKRWMTIVKDGDDIIFDIRSRDSKGDICKIDGEILISALPFDEFNVTIPDNVTKIADFAFDGCANLKVIVVDSRNLVYDSRNNCNAIIETATNILIKGCQNTVIPEDVTSIGDEAFSGCIGLEKIHLPNSLKSIGNCAFTGTGLTDIELPYSVDDMGIATFCGCKNLRLAKIPNHVRIYNERSDEYQFLGCPCEIIKY